MRIALTGRIAVLLVVSLLGVGWIAAPPASAAVAPVSELVIDAEPGATVGQGDQLVFSPAGGKVLLATSTDKKAIKISVGDTPCSADTCAYELSFAVPTGGADFAPGTWYEHALKAPTATDPQLDIRSADAACESTNGRFFVDDVQFTGSVITTFVARFEQHCEGEAPALFGAVSINSSSSTANWYSRSVTPDPLDFSSVAVGRAETLKLLYDPRSNSTSLTPTGFAITGLDAAAFKITSNACSISTATTDCEIAIEFTPAKTGTSVATLTWKDELAMDGPDDAPATLGTGREVLLTGVGTVSSLTIGKSGDFANTRVGTFGEPVEFTATNTGTEPVAIDDVVVVGDNPSSFSVDDGCDDAALEAGESCQVEVTPYPTAGGVRRATLRFLDDALGSPHNTPLAVFGTMGYFLAEADGTVTEFGDAVHAGDMSGASLNGPVLGITGTRTGDGYWMVGTDGGVFSFGDADFHGSVGGQPLNAPVLALDATGDDQGYWMVARDGGIFSFGNAEFHGSMGGLPLNKPVVGMAATPDGSGYWLVAEDGGIFAFNAPFKGSMGGQPLNQPIVGMVPTVTGQGYYLIALDGGVFAFGDAKFVGSMGGSQLEAPVVSIAPTATGYGYWMVNTVGEVFPFGDAVSFGDLQDSGADDVMAVTATAPFVDPARLDGPSEWPATLPRTGSVD